MNNQAAQTMPELPEPFDTVRVNEFSLQEAPVFSAGQMRAMYQQGYAAALSQTAGVVLARGWFHALPDEDDYEFHDDASGAGKNCDGCIRATIVAAPAASGGEDGPQHFDGHDHEGFPGGCERFCHSSKSCPAAASVSERARDDLHVAICQAVALMNMEPMTTAGLLQAHDILRKAIS